MTGSVVQDGVGDVALENVLRAEPACNVQPLLPPLKFAALLVAQPLDATKLFKRFVLVVVEVDVDSVPYMTRNLAPGTLPLV